jgi:hypothetical protein
MERVLRLLRGEPLDAVPRESQVPAHELEGGWKRVFLEAGGRGLKSRSDPEERELTLARAKVGELTMRREWPSASTLRMQGTVTVAPDARRRSLAVRLVWSFVRLLGTRLAPEPGVFSRARRPTAPRPGVPAP